MKNKMSVKLIMCFYLLLVSSFSFADDAIFYVDGMSCPFCTFGLEKKLNKIGGITDVQIILKTGEVKVSSTKKLKEATLKEAVKDAGFSIREDKIIFSLVKEVTK